LVQVSHDTKPATLFETENKPRIRIVLVDDHSIMRECLRGLIEVDQRFEVVGEFDSAEECLKDILDLKPDVMLTDLGLPGRTGIDLLGEVNRISPLTRKLVLTAHDNIQYVSAAIGAGANGYVLKRASGEELMRAIRAVSAGQHFLCKAITAEIPADLLADYRNSIATVTARPITKREHEVLTCVACGQTTKVIARTLNVSPKTVAKHRANLMRKLQLHNIAAITAFAIRNGLTGEMPHGSPVATQPRFAVSLT
jgi:DNA-binding NarL/FixJ family response regulator